jgi:deoxyribodipyrimidine photolyase-like uncharacterized protein
MSRELRAETGCKWEQIFWQIIERNKQTIRSVTSMKKDAQEQIDCTNENLSRVDERVNEKLKAY